VLFTAYDTPRLRKDATRVGVAAFISKPFFLDEFVGIVRGFLPIKSSEMGS
jgi:DNA-binding NarL/FixJ family response regulator